MGKRSNFARRVADDYDTPAAALAPLLPHLEPATRFIEPCAGRGCLVRHMAARGHVCVASCDLPIDARDHRYLVEGATCFLTNPPWTRQVLHPLIVNLSDQLPTWLLIDFDWLATKQSAPFLPRLRTILPIGRVRWIEDSPWDGKDNATWCFFTRPSNEATVFIGRVDDAQDRLRAAA